MTPVMQAANGYLTDWTSPVLNRTAKLLGPRYTIARIEEDSEGGYVRFDDPAMNRADWTGPIYGGIVRYSKAELLRLEADPNSDPRIREKVETAKDALFELVTAYRKKETSILQNMAVKVVLTLSMVMTGISYLA